MPTAITKRELLDQVMGGKLAEYVASRRPSRSWQGIAGDIRADYGIYVTDESLRQWFPDLKDTNA